MSVLSPRSASMCACPAKLCARQRACCPLRAPIMAFCCAVPCHSTPPAQCPAPGTSTQWERTQAESWVSTQWASPTTSCPTSSRCEWLLDVLAAAGALWCSALIHFAAWQGRKPVWHLPCWRGEVACLLHAGWAAPSPLCGHPDLRASPTWWPSRPTALHLCSRLLKLRSSLPRCCARLEAHLIGTLLLCRWPSGSVTSCACLGATTPRPMARASGTTSTSWTLQRGM